MLMAPQAVVQDRRTWWHSFSLQAIICLAFGVLLPPVVYFLADFEALLRDQPAVNSIFASLVAAASGLFLARKVNGYPGVKQLGSAVPGFAIVFGLVALCILATRVNYSVSILALNFGATIAAYVLYMLFAARSDPNVFYAVPGGRIGRLDEFGIVSIPMVEPVLPVHRGAIVVADLHYDMPAVWERMLAQAALDGIPVFHYKQVYEAATGKVRVEHLSENSLGSLLPNMSYIRAKRALDTIVALLALPLLLVPFCVVAIAIKLDTPGPVLFRQKRVGYRGKSFLVTKFRTMRQASEIESGEDERLRAMTTDSDPRITKVGALLRRTRIDELPQIFNVIRGDMSWIGPRPEAIELSKWYEHEIPFYSYRHIVRPGLTGWAQVNQGHVVHLGDINDKLQYDFFYIKHFSYWLDILIVFRTIAVVLSGYGSK